MRLDGKVALVTGGTRGLGLAVTRALLAEGARVMTASREPDSLVEVGAAAERIGFTKADVTDGQSMQRLVAHTVAEFGGLDIMVANAGVSRPGPVGTLSAEDWTSTIQTNLTGAFHSVQAAIPAMSKHGGRIILMSSALAHRVAPGAAAYCASKAAIEMFARVAAVELAPEGILVNCLCPGLVDSGMGAALRENEQVWKRYAPKLASGRLGTADEVAAAAVFLAGPDSAYVSGHSLEVNGGLDW